MSPYFAIVKDSFREALASRVLWVLLVLITLILLALTPFHWKSTTAARLTMEDIRNVRNLSNALLRAKADNAPPLLRHVWDQLDAKTKEQLEGLDRSRGPQAFRAREAVLQDFNSILDQEDFYQESLWAEATLDERFAELQSQASLDASQRQQRNRLALEAALPGQLRACPDDAVMFRYARWDLDFVPPIGRRMAQETLDTFIMGFMSVFVGFFGIFSAVLVTAPMIPNMFDSGSLYALLSKPVSRPLLFISKFVGGCSFVVINAAYLILGLWAIVALRFGITKPSLLWSIPIFVFSFAIFYSVSAVAGLIWRSTVMSIVATIIFWFVCTTVGSTKDVLEQFVMAPQRIRSVLRTDQELFAIRRSGTIVRWDLDAGELQDVLTSENQANGPPMMMGRDSVRGMVFAPEPAELVVLERGWSQRNILVGRRDNDWKRQVVAPPPGGAAALFLDQGHPIAVADGGVYRISTVIPEESTVPEINIFGLKIPTPTQKPTHTNISADITESLPGDARISRDPSTEDIYVYGFGILRRWHREEDDIYRELKRDKVGIRRVRQVAAGGGRLFFATLDEQVQIHVLDGQTFDAQQVLDFDTDVEIRKLSCSADGRWLALLLENDRGTLIDLQENRRVQRLPRQGTITDLSFSGPMVLISDANDRVVSLGLPDLKERAGIQPSQSWIAKVYRYAVKPIHTVFPKPAQLQHTMQYAITGKQTMTVDGPPNVAGTTFKLDPWQPIWSNSLFILVMLLLGCVYMQRQDF